MTGMDANTGRPLAGIAHLRQSVRDILTTPVGSRVMRREYGSRLFELLDAPAGPATQVDIYAATASAVGRWEPRLRLRQVRAIQNGPGRIGIDLEGDYLPDGVPVRLAGIEVATPPPTAILQAPTPVALRSALAIGPVTLTATLDVGAPAAAVLRSAVAIGPATLAATLAVEAPAPVALRSAVEIGPATLAAALAVEAPVPVALRSAVEIGPATLTAALTVEAPTGLGINSIPAQSNERARALVTAGAAGVWYSIFGSQSSGSYEGDLDIGSVSTLNIDRIWWTANANRDMRFNRNPANTPQPGSDDDFSEWISEGSWAFYLLFEGLTEPLVLLASDRRSVGVHYLNITATAAQALLLSTVGEDDLVNIVVADAPVGG